MRDNGIRALVRSPERARVPPAGVQPVHGDVTDPSSLRAALDGCATVYHVAGVPEQWRRDVSVFTQVNVEGTRNVVEAALAAGVERFVYTSTMDVLVQTADVPFDEPVIDASPCPTPYQRSEQEGNRIVTAALDRGLPAVFLYPSGVYGEAPFLAPGLNDLLVRLAKRDVPVLLPGRMSVVYTATTSLARSCRGSCRCRSPESPRGPVGSARPGRAGLELDAVPLGPRPHAGVLQATTLDLNRGH